MLKTTDHVIYGATSVYALRGDEGVVKWETNSTVFVPRTDPCFRCEHRPQCLVIGGGKIDVTNCPTAEGWHDAKAAYEVSIAVKAS